MATNKVRSEYDEKGHDDVDDDVDDFYYYY
jgi:hypothetical protein